MVTPTEQSKARSSARFDAWNSSSTGHQRSDHRPGTPWRDARRRNLNAQFAGRDVAPPPPPPPATMTRRSVVDMLARPGLMAEDRRRPVLQAAPGTDAPADAPPKKRPIFDGLVVYVNGSTYPLVSDHRLKHLLREHGASLSLHLARRSVTHVVLARPASGPGTRTAGGGLAGGKLDREVRRTAGCGVKYVDVEWILESIKAGIRLPEARFPAVKTAARGQHSVYPLYSPQAPSL